MLVLGNTLSPLLTPLTEKKEGRIKRQGAHPSLSMKELERLQKENRLMSLEETLEVISDT